MSFRVKLRVKSWKLPDLVEHARRYRRAVDDAWRAPYYPKGNECVPAGCSVCGLKFTDPMGRPIAMGYVCGNARCPTGLGSATSSIAQNGPMIGQAWQ